MTPTSVARRSRAGRVAALLLSIGVVTIPIPVAAHGSLAAGDFYTGLLQPVFHLDALLPLVALALWSTQLDEVEVWRLPAVFTSAALVGGGAAILGFRVQAAAWTPQMAMLVLGLLVATRLSPSRIVVLALGVAGGLAHGYAGLFNEQGGVQRPILYLLGACSSIGLLCFHLESLVLRFEAFWMHIAVRVVGSWIAAIGLLVSVLEVARAARGNG